MFYHPILLPLLIAACSDLPLPVPLSTPLGAGKGICLQLTRAELAYMLIAFSWLPTSLGVVVFALLTRWRCKCRRRDALPPSATGRFWQQQLERGTVYLPRLKPPTHCCSSGERQKRTSSTGRFWTNLRTIADSRTPQCSQHACLNYVQCPCKVSMWQSHSNLFLINNNNNHNNAKTCWLHNKNLMETLKFKSTQICGLKMQHFFIQAWEAVHFCLLAS